METPFGRVAKLPALQPYCRPEPAEPSRGKVPAERPGISLAHVLTGLTSGARSLCVGALGRARAGLQPNRTAVVLAVVESPDAAHELISDLRAWRAVEEHERAPGAGKRASDPAPKRKRGHTASQDAEQLKVDEARAKELAALLKDRSETWGDSGLPAKASLPEDLHHGLPLETLLFPAWDVLPTESDRPEGLALSGRQSALDRLKEVRVRAAHTALPDALVLAAPIAALMQPVESPAESHPALILRKGEEHDPIELAKKLSAAGFDRTGQVEVRGEFSLRGGILDVFPYAGDTPYRFEFFGDAIESIHPFDPFTQRSQEAVPEVALADYSPERLKKLFSPGATSGPHSLLDHLPPDALILWLDPVAIERRGELYAASLVSGKSLCLPVSDLRGQASRQTSLDLCPPVGTEQVNAEVPEDAELPEAPPEPADEARAGRIACTSVQRFQGEIDKHATQWKRLCASRMAVYVFCETGGDRQRLEQLFTEAGVLPAPTLQLVLGKLSGGFDLRAAGLTAITDREILGRGKHAEAPRAKVRMAEGARALSSVFELTPGDFVVHTTHGIGRYLGLARLEQSGRMEDYLTLQFADQVKLYVPAAMIHLVGKYIGGDPSPELSRLGSKIWQRRKERVQGLLRDLAEDLLKVQAARKSLPGIVHAPDTDWQRAFEASFPYPETPDQLAAVAAVKRDLEATFPMDRLLCGDVGFGKTEVAVRAAFKAVMSGKQAAVLVPTTLLCEQHGRTFAERFAGYPVSVETLSRFKTPGEQKRLIQRLATGRLDVVIGTHRLIQKDVRFKDLGVAVIDEEQRFGVEHKEFFKRLRKSVDVLTLTATPIPRTLHMAMLGLRDISNLATPPRNRLSVHTRVARLSDDLLRRSILRELSRGGQIFVIHPRVMDIQEFAARLKELVPEARFDIGHGQMNPDDLEAVMHKFLHGETDVLVSTTIVENGLDIPRANTILVHEADRFGLAELHQLRGRVGRSEIQAYCYLLLPERQPITPEGLRRLRALEEFDELGAGFQLAMRDLEIRGAGNVLGGEQSGQIAEVGYDLYCKLLESTVRQIRGEPPPQEELEASVQLGLPAYVPENYIEDEKAVLELYRRLEQCGSDKEAGVLLEEMQERFGPPPAPLLRLFEEANLRRRARKAGVPYIGLDKEVGRLILKFHEWDIRATDYALRGLPEARDVRVLDKETLSFGLLLKAKSDAAALYAQVAGLLETLGTFREKRGTRAPAPAGK